MSERGSTEEARRTLDRIREGYMAGKVSWRVKITGEEYENLRRVLARAESTWAGDFAERELREVMESLQAESDENFARAERAEERTRVLEGALREEWEMNHAGRCTDLACCKGNGRAPGCYYPMPAALDQETETP